MSLSVSQSQQEKALSLGLDVDDLMGRAKTLVSAAKRAGATEADAYVGIGRSQSVRIRDGEVEVAERSEGDGFTLRVFVGDRHAQVSSNSPGEEDQLAERAVAMAKVSPPDAYTVLGDADKLAKDLPDLDLFDAQELSSDALGDMAKRAEAAALSVQGVTNTNSAGASSGIRGMVLVTSHGFEGATLSSSFG